MTTPLLTTKLYIPSVRSNLVPRPHLIERLNESLRLGRKLTFISTTTVLTDQDWQRLQVPTLFLVGKNEVTHSAHKAVQHLATVESHAETAIMPDSSHHQS